MTDTDLITAGDSAPQTDAPAVTAQTPPAPESQPAESRGAEQGADAGGSLSTMVLPELRALANRVGVKGTSGMRKGELIAAIRDTQNGGNSGPRGGANGAPATEAASEPATSEPATATREDAVTNGTEQPRRERRTANRGAGAPSEGGDQQKPAGESQAKSENRQQNRESSENRQQNRESNDQGGDAQGGGQQNRGGDDDGERGQGRRGRRFRDRRRRGERTGGEGGGGNEAELREDDVVQPVAGILDVLDNYAFVRTSGYLAGPNDVYVSMNMVRKNGLRRGDAVTGAVRVAKDGEQNEPAAEVQPAGAPRHRQRRTGRGGQEPPRVRQADPAVPEPAAAAGDHPRQADHPRDRPDHADRQGAARADRVPAQGR